jgi:hypothetical protein
VLVCFFAVAEGLAVVCFAVVFAVVDVALVVDVVFAVVVAAFVVDDVDDLFVEVETFDVIFAVVFSVELSVDTLLAAGAEVVLAVSVGRAFEHPKSAENKRISAKTVSNCFFIRQAPQAFSALPRRKP